MGLAACSKDKGSAQDEQTEVEVSKEEKVDDDQVVLLINDKEITGETYNLIYAQRKTQLHRFGQDVTDTALLKKETIDSIIDQELLKQDAKSKGIKVSEEEVNKEYESIKEENKDQFDSFLKQYYLTEETFKEQLLYALIHNKYVKQEIPDVHITDDEIEEAYNELKEQNEKIPELNEVKEQLQSELKARKEQELLQEKVAKLREKAEIETKI